MSIRGNEYSSDRKLLQNYPYIKFKLGKLNLKDLPYDEEKGAYSIVLAIADVGKTTPTHIDESTDPSDYKFNYDSSHETSSDSYYIYKKNLDDSSNSKNDGSHYYAVRPKKMNYLYFVTFKVDKKVDVSLLIFLNILYVLHVLFSNL